MVNSAGLLFSREPAPGVRQQAVVADPDGRPTLREFTVTGNLNAEALTAGYADLVRVVNETLDRLAGLLAGDDPATGRRGSPVLDIIGLRGNIQKRSTSSWCDCRLSQLAQDVVKLGINEAAEKNDYSTRRVQQLMRDASNRSLVTIETHLGRANVYRPTARCDELANDPAHPLQELMNECGPRDPDHPASGAERPAPRA